MNKELVNVLKENISVKEDKLVEKDVAIKNLSFLQLRDAIWMIGRVIVEQENNNIYIAAIKSSKMLGNTAYLAIKLLPERLEIVGYAEEGLFNQNTVEKAILRLEGVLK